MKREDLVRQTQDLIDQGDRIARAPSRAALNTWLAASDALLSSAWGQMDRYHQAWLDVGRIAQPLRGRQISEGEEADEVRAVVTLEDSSRMTGWLERQVAKAHEACRAELTAFAKNDRASGDR